MSARHALAVSDVGFTAFVERNQPRYSRYAKARLAEETSVAAVLRATLSFAHRHWHWLMGQPSPAADIWEELRYQVELRVEEASPGDPGVTALYYGLPATSADSVLLCRRLGLEIDEAAELMGLEPPAIEAGLGVADRALPRLVVGRRPRRHL